MSMKLDPELLLRAYAIGVFPMADSHDAPDVFWVEPKRRGIIPLDGFHLSRSLAKTLRSDRFQVTADKAFDDVMRACAEPAPERDETWINAAILEGYQALHRRGHAHSIECWRDGTLVGGLYGVSLGGAFFGESMFSRVRDASKIALAHLVARLRFGGYTLLDTQFVTPHLASLGAVEIPRNAYRGLLADAVAGAGAFGAIDAAGGDTADREVSPAPPSPSVGDAALGVARGTGAATVSGPISGKRISQLLTQTS